LTEKNGFWYLNTPASKDALAAIRTRIEPFHLSMNDKDISVFNTSWVVSRKDVGVSWIKP
ncbi:MAG: hypothetical protein JST39_08335, partial [Bacteroidetes bacterium]|nr:hypothetical protein [Bacteroidota bacterium]